MRKLIAITTLTLTATAIFADQQIDIRSQSQSESHTYYEFINRQQQSLLDAIRNQNRLRGCPTAPEGYQYK